MKSSLSLFILKSNKIHNNLYDYSKVNYINDATKVCIICYKHKEFWQSPNSHLQGHGCKKCKVELNSHKKLLSTEQFIEKANKIHNNLYDYSKVKYQGIFNKVIIICKKHGEFIQSPNKHINCKQGCPKCKLSKSELLIEQYLKEHNINFIPQKQFKECKNIKPLPFDFYLPDYNTCIEYDGELHYEISRKFARKNALEKLKLTQLRDNIKTFYCKQNKINLLRIPYWNKNNIIELINQFILSIKQLSFPLIPVI
jgi:very-short-patch-repair endonuclease